MLRVPLKTPFKTSLRTVEEIADVVVIMDTDTGHRGYGSAPATAVITGETHGSIIEAISKVIEPYVTDAPVQASGWLYRMFGLAFKVVQVGYVRIYAVYMVIGLSILSLLLSRSLNF